jgi:2-dehydro-3-deoxyglucarate aldolase/4-hydroxy-2-oxoheptanedioate aldolase
MSVDDGIPQRLADGGTVLGTFVFEFATLGIGRLAASAGAEFVIFDTEHTGWGWETVAAAVATTRPTGAHAFVRVPLAQRSYLSRALDVGATGLVVPMVESAAQAADLVSWSRYPPAGVRGAAFGIAHDDYAAAGANDYMVRANTSVMLLPQIETAAGLDAVEEIAAVDGIDVLWLGHFDLTNSMGIPGRFDHPDYLAAVDRIAAAATAHGKTAGFMASSPDEAAMMIERGYRILAYGGDLWLYRAALCDGLEKVRAHAKG